LIDLKSKFENVYFHFKKFDCSSEKVEKMINTQLNYRPKEVRNKGIGYVEIPPPFNENYSSIPMSDEEFLALLVKGYGPPIEEPTSRPSRDKVDIPKLESVLIRISKPTYRQPKQEQAPSKTFVTSQDASKKTETLSFEKIKEIDRVFEISKDEVHISTKSNELPFNFKEPKLESVKVNELTATQTTQSDSNVTYEFDFMKQISELCLMKRANRGDNLTNS